MRKKLLASVLVLALLAVCVAVPIMLLQPTRSDDVVILYTNDIHTNIDKALRYDTLAAIKDDLEDEYEHVLLMDAGDHSQGTAYGSMDSGKTIIELMNAADYDIATMGNHEFDYGMDGFLNMIEWADFPYVSCNFYREENGVRGENLVDSYVMFDCGEMKIAVVGITTPESFSTPTYFQDENGNFIYGMDKSASGEGLYADVQNAVDAAEAAGATMVIALGHLGKEDVVDQWSSLSVIANTSGIDVFIDGHSHSIVKGEEVADEEGNNVLLTQTGEYFDRIGMMVIDSETGDVKTDFIEINDEDTENPVLSSALYTGTQIISDPDVKAKNDAWLAEIENRLGAVIGSFDKDVALMAHGPYGDVESAHIIRSQETNAGNFTADALYYLFDNMGMDVDVAIMNGGGILGKTVTPVTGEISYMTCKNIHMYGNVACLQTVTGQQILDALEWGSRIVGKGLKGSFLQVAGLKYKLDTSIESTVQGMAEDVWKGAPTGKYRVYDVEVYDKEADAYVPLDLEAEYNMAGYNYTLRLQGDGFAMFEGCVNVLDYVMEDYQVLANYINGFENATVGATNSPLLAKYPSMLLDYSKQNGCGRIYVGTDGE